MSLVDHLGELRTRIFRALLAVVAGSVVGFYFAERVRDTIVRILPSGQVQILGPGDAFGIKASALGDIDPQSMGWMATGTRR